MPWHAYAGAGNGKTQIEGISVTIIQFGHGHRVGVFSWFRYERRFFSDGLALAPVPGGPAVPLTPEVRPALGIPPINEGGVSSGRVGGVGPRGSRRDGATGGECEEAPRPRSTEYMRGGGPPFSALSEVCGERLTVVAWTIGGDAEAA